MNISKKILRAINEGVMNALVDYDDDITVNKISNANITTLLIKNTLNNMYKDELDIARSNHKEFIVSDNFILLAENLYKNHNEKFLPDIVPSQVLFNEFIYSIVGKFGEERPNANLNWIDTSNITYMGDVFRGTITNRNKFNGDISEWDMSNVLSTTAMFMYSDFNNDSICNWDVSLLESTIYMFYGSSFNLNIRKWNTKNLKLNRTKDMFYKCYIPNEFRPIYTPKVKIY